MGLILNWRTRVANSILALLGLNGRFVICEQDRVSICRLEIARYLLYIIPLFTMKREYSISLRDFVHGISKRLGDDYSTVVIEHLHNLSEILQKSLRRSITDAVRKINKTFADDIQSGYAEFHVRFIDTLLEDFDRKLRRALADAFYAKTTPIFKSIVTEQLGMLIFRIKEAQKRTNDIRLGNGNSFVLPSATRFVYHQGNFSVYVVEQAPGMRTVSFKDHGKFRLAYPFIIFFVALEEHKNGMSTIRSLHVFFRNEPLKQEKDQLYCPAFPDVFDNFSVCFPAHGSSGEPADVVHRNIENFWNSEFQNPQKYHQQVLNHYQKSIKKDTRIATFQKWQAASADPTFIRTVSWIGAGYTVETEAQRIFDELGVKKTNSLSVSDFEKYVSELGNNVADALQEQLYGLIPKTEWNNNSLAIAKEKMSSIMSQSAQQLQDTASNALKSCMDQAKLEARVVKLIDDNTKSDELLSRIGLMNVEDIIRRKG